MRIWAFIVFYGHLAQALGLPSTSLPWPALLTWRTSRSTGLHLLSVRPLAHDEPTTTPTIPKDGLNITSPPWQPVDRSDWLVSVSLSVGLKKRPRPTNNVVYRLEPYRMIPMKYRGTRTTLPDNATAIVEEPFLEDSDHSTPTRTTVQQPRPLSWMDAFPSLLCCFYLATFSMWINLRGIVAASRDTVYLTWLVTFGFGRGIHIASSCVFQCILRVSATLDFVLNVACSMYSFLLFVSELCYLTMHMALEVRERWVLEPKCIERKARRRVPFSVEENDASTSHIPDKEDASGEASYYLLSPDHFVEPYEMDLENNVLTEIDLDPRKLLVLGRIGRGAFGDLHRIKDDISGHIMAVKRLVKANNEEEDVRTELLAMLRVREKEGWYTKLFGVFSNFHYFYVLMPFYEQGDLLSNIKKCDGCLRRTVAKFYLAEMLLGIQHLHHMGIIHRDIKPANVLFSNDGHIVIADFGIAYLFPSPEEQAADLFMDEEYPIWESKRLMGGDEFPLLVASSDNPHVTAGMFGTPFYSPPEVREGEAYSYGVDYYSMGVLFYEMITGNLPVIVAEDDLVLDFGKKGHHLQDVSLIELDFVKKLLSQDPFDRPSVKDMKSHPVFKGIDWGKLASRELAVPVPASMVLRKRGTPATTTRPPDTSSYSI